MVPAEWPCKLNCRCALFWSWHWPRNHRTPKLRNSGDTANANPLLDGRRREERKDRPVAWGTIRVWNPSDDSIVVEPALLLHKIFFRRTSNLSRYLDTIELGPKENAEFQIEILEEVIPASFRPLSAQFVSSNCWLKFIVIFELESSKKREKGLRSFCIFRENS